MKAEKEVPSLSMGQLQSPTGRFFTCTIGSSYGSMSGEAALLKAGQRSGAAYIRAQPRTTRRSDTDRSWKGGKRSI